MYSIVSFTQWTQQAQGKFNKMNTKELIDGLNEVNFTAFPQKDNPKKVTLSVLGEDGKRYFLNRLPIGGSDEAGKLIYGWVIGNAMRPMKEVADAKKVDTEKSRIG